MTLEHVPPTGGMNNLPPAITDAEYFGADLLTMMPSHWNERFISICKKTINYLGNSAECEEKFGLDSLTMGALAETTCQLAR